MNVWYLDSSAIVKLAVSEMESGALAAWRADLAADDALMTCELAVAEVIRAVRRVDGDVGVALAHLDAVDQLVMDRDLLLAAGRLDPGSLRTLDAIHLAAAQAGGDDLRGVITYDDRMADAASGLGLQNPCARPIAGVPLSGHRAFGARWVTRSRIPHQVTRTRASTTTRIDIFDTPRSRSTNSMGRSTTLPPSRATR